MQHSMHDCHVCFAGAERFSDYRGYASSFSFDGDHVDNTVKCDDDDCEVVAWSSLMQFALQGFVGPS